MKITKLSLVAIAAMTMTTGAMADLVSNIKLDGQVKYWYETNDKSTNDLFDKTNATGDAALTVGATADLGPIKVGTKVYAVSSMGLENSLVTGNRTARATNDGTEAWIGQLHGTGVIGKTSIKAGRMALNTPFVFTEAWNVVPNTFEAITVTNTDIGNVKLVATAVKRGNAANTGGTGAFSTGGGFKVAANGEFTTFDANILSAHTKLGPVGVNGYYTDVTNAANTSLTNISSYWVDATVPVGPAKLTAIYAGTQQQGAGTSAADLSAFALKATAKFSGVSILGAYSAVSEDVSTLAIANVATSYKKTKLPTAGVYTDGLYVGQAGSKAMKIKAVTKLAGFKIIGQVIKNTNDISASRETTEIDLILVKKIGAATVKAIFLNRSFANAGDAVKDPNGDIKNTEGNHVRVIASYNF